MTLAAGEGASLGARTCFGPYEIVSAIGAGGMGEVYKARDTRLGRTVALKVLPLEAAADPERRRRFEQEARAASALSHPHICVLHDIGCEGDVHFLVMEYLEGETLAERLMKGPLRLAQALEYGAQIADALNKAHRQGIVHRDLKPSNVMLTADGAKLLDFGLAKLKHAGRAAPTAVTTTGWAAGAPLTESGTLLGTVAYMAPEQLEGGEIDARADLFAFGAVLYEMLTARRAFEGKTPASVIASILAGEPPRLLDVQPLAPPAVARVIATCLQKDPNDRWQTAHDLRLQLQAIAADGGAGRRWRDASWRRLRWPAIAVLFLAAIALAGTQFRGRPVPAPPVRFTIALPSGASFGDQPNLAVSPDGRYVAYTAKLRGSSTTLWLRAMDATESRELPETAGAQFPFWAPDSQAVGFVSGGALHRIDLRDAKPRVIARLSPQQQVGSAAWGSGDVVVFASGTGLYRVPAQGGEPTLIAERPQRFRGIRGFVPDGRALVSEWDAAASYWSAFAVPLDGSGNVSRIANGFAVQAAPERLLLVRDGMLIAQRFDSRAQRVLGEPAILAEAVDAWDAAASAGELLVYRPRPRTELAWFDRAGRRLGALGSLSTDYLWFALSPDGTRAAVERGRPIEVGDIWLFDLARPSVPLRLSHQGTRQSDPVWSGDGRRLAYATMGAGRSGIQWRSIGDGGQQEHNIPLQAPAWPTDWTADGRYLVVATPAFGTSGSSMDVALIPADGGGTLQPLIATGANEAQARLSPDGRWIAYTSDESGRPEVYVQRFPEPGERIGVSAGGGAQPVWRRDGRELFYVDLDRRLMSVPMETGARITAGKPRLLFELPSYGFEIFYGVRNVYDVAPDGERFLVLARNERDASSLTVVTNFTSALAGRRD
ncbi:MAG TPA: protein kinase [Vicinamibacterales bacterium]|nr:protein kinase [Vicinamibacterales bacterium]